jgi:hypothetical protein
MKAAYPGEPRQETASSTCQAQLAALRLRKFATGSLPTLFLDLEQERAYGIRHARGIRTPEVAGKGYEQVDKSGKREAEKG